MTGDYLLQRLGVPTEYFEVMADARELNGWRDREDICLIIFEQPQKAQQLLETYQKKYRKKTPFEEQFLKKMQTILLMQAYKKRFESKSVDVEREKSEGENLVESFQSFKEKLDVNVPLNRQEVLFMESDILYKRKGHYDWLMQMRSGRFRYCMAKIVSAVLGGVVLYLISVLLFFALCLILVSGVRSESTVESITHLFASTECYWYRVVSAIGYYPMVILFAF